MRLLKNSKLYKDILAITKKIPSRYLKNIDSIRLNIGKLGKQNHKMILGS